MDFSRLYNPNRGNFASEIAFAQMRCCFSFFGQMIWAFCLIVCASTRMMNLFLNFPPALHNSTMNLSAYYWVVDKYSKIKNKLIYTLDVKKRCVRQKLVPPIWSTSTDRKVNEWSILITVNEMFEWLTISFSRLN